MNCYVSLHSTSGEKLDNKSAHLAGAHGGVGQNLLLSPASLQLAQLQAQLTLHRLKLAQTTNSATAATVLNQVLSNVAMSQPLFNHLRGSSMAQPHSGAFPPPPIAFPPPNAALGQLVGGGFAPNPTGIRPTNYSGVSSQKPSQHNDFGKKPGTYSTDTDRLLQFGYLGGASVVTSKACDGGQYGGASTQSRNNVHSNFQRYFYSPETPVQQTGLMGGSNNQNLGSASKDQWKGPINFGKMDIGTGTGSGGWVPPGPGFVGQRAELYNPEEPTADPKFNSTCGPGIGPPTGQQGGIQQQPQVSQGEEGVTLQLQPHQFNDYHGTIPSHLPHQCTICEKKVYNLKHLHYKCNVFSTTPNVDCIRYMSSEGCLNMALSNTMAYTSAASQGKTQISKFFVQRKACPGHVVHICNLPEGSCTENDVINLGLPFGKVTNYILMRSTHQAFLEMAYVEAAQAMVQYYQLQPATINGHKLLIRMSKRYKELQLKKPGKDVDSIIQDINSQRERDEMQETDRYLPERDRSRSPVSRSLSPRSHSPSFTSCSSAHSPPGPPCRLDWSNGMGPRRPSWGWTSHSRGDEDPHERDDWRNDEEERPNGWLSERRKPYLKTGDRISPRMGPGDERGRDWYPRGSLQGSSFSSYHSIDDFYKKDSLYKTDKLSRPQHQRHEGKTKRREGGDYHRPRHSESDVMDDTNSNRTAEDRGRSKRPSRRQDREEKEPENQGLESVDDGEEESWYPKSMEELVTVDEVGGEDDSIVEPDLPDLHEEDQRVEPSQSTAESPKPNAKTPTEGEETTLDPPTLPLLVLVPEESSGGAQSSPGERPSAPEQPHFITPISSIPDIPGSLPAPSPQAMDIFAASPSQEQEKAISEHSIPLGTSTRSQKGRTKRRKCHLVRKTKKEVWVWCRSDFLLVLLFLAGVEFIVPRTGYYCNLCSLFYTSEQTAKMSHCRSTIHYRNLQTSRVFERKS
uniref:RNA binding motif protein 20 n=1 Tax=Sinocyclocheilus anshuiensis TaxID=1608454 RepID=A0A671S7X2_9TELE